MRNDYARARSAVAEMSSDSEDEDGVLVIGIDFGTTYSGVAWASKDDFEQKHINLITSWPGSGREEGKTPTELYYEDGKVSWGFEIDSDTDPIKWFKLLLLREEDLSSELRSSEFLLRARKMMRENEKTATELISDYLRKIWKHTLETINKDRGAAVEALQFHVVITVPAIWKDYARQHMTEAANKAGILDRRTAGKTRLTFAPEPEAAALSTLCETGRGVKPDEVYLVCDAGGGTVDLISYKIGSVNPIQMEEAVEGTGGLCGGIFIDEDFEVIIKNRLGRRWDKLSKVGSKELLKGEWELSIKPQFKPTSSSKEYLVSVPAEAFQGKGLTDTTKEPHIKNGRIHFNESHIRKAFTKVFTEIDTLIDAQVRKAKDKGHALNVINWDEAVSKTHNTLKNSTNSGTSRRTAICRGAVYKGFHDGAASAIHGGGHRDQVRLPILVTSTISRASYGHGFHERFEEGKHLEKDKWWNEAEGMHAATKQMQWYLTKGENVSTKELVSHEFYNLYEEGDFNGSFELELYQCDEDSPPSRRESSVKGFTKIECKIDISWSDLEDYQNAKGANFKKLCFDVRMVPSGASVEFAVFANGKRIGGSNINVHYK
ncbi:hypothetical protein ACHAP5_008045 [Fusarium lateritium]